MATAPSAQAPKELTVHHGTVKQVLSGDTVVIRGQVKGGPPPERTLSLAGITAPRLARRPTGKDAVESKDEPFAWEAREFLRKKLIGKEVEFTVEYKVPSGREFGTVLVGKENVTQALVKEGLVSIREGGGKGQPSQEQQELAALAAAAQSAHKGIHGAPEAVAVAVRNIVWNPENLRAIVDGAKGKPVDAIVENVRDACTFRVFLLPSFQNVNIALTGIKTPTFKYVDGKEIPEPLAEASRFFTESRLLQREVKVLLEGVSGQSILATVQHPAGNISELLLQQGYGRVVDWSIGMVTKGREAYRAAETSAKLSKLRVWAGHVASERADIADREFTGVVEEIVNPECIVVRHGGTSRKIFLSSVRQPRPAKEEPAAAAAAAPASAGAGADKRRRVNYWEIPWMSEAREFLRKKVVGQQVQVHIDYVKPTDGMPDRTCATVKIGGVNVAEALVSKGYATVVRYRDGDEDRASCFDDLLAAETRAQKNQKGVHSKDQPAHRINDVNTRAVAEKLLTSFTRQGRIAGVVEHVVSGSRLRVMLPKESCQITFLLAGLSVPRASGGDRPSEPFGDDALALVRNTAMQRDVELEFETIDKTGCFVGHLFVDGKNLSLLLGDVGLAKLHSSSESSKYAGPLQASVSAAKSARKGLWADYVEPVEEPKADAAAEPRARRVDIHPVVVTEISDAVTFWAQAPSGAGDLDRILSTIAHTFSTAPPSAHTPKRNELVAVRFSADGNWYRAKIVKINSSTDIEVHYVDFGNSESVSAKEIAALPPGLTMPALAVEYRIAFISAPPKDYCPEAVDYLKQRILNRTVGVNVEFKDGSVDVVSVEEEGTHVDVGRDMVEEGVVLFRSRLGAHVAPLMKTYAAAQAHAKSKRLGIWQYGDATADD